MKGKSTIIIDDTTLREGEQTPGVVFTKGEKIEIAVMLDEIGVREIEAGIPAMGGEECEAVKAIVSLGLRARIMAWNRPLIPDIEASLTCGVEALALSLPASDLNIRHKLRRTRSWVLEQIVDATGYAKAQGAYVSVNAEDASRADPDFLLEFARTARRAGADRLRFCDTVGILDPFQTYDVVSRLRHVAEIEIEMHTHNDFGLATANALAGIRAGARYVNTTVNGLGERAGNACLSEVTMGLKHILKMDPGIKTGGLRKISRYVAEASRRNVPPNKPITGSDIFTHESGIHADAVLKHPRTYEPFAPDEVAAVRRIVIGKHSGARAVRFKFASEFDIDVPEEMALEIVREVRVLAIREKRVLSDSELLEIYDRLHHSQAEADRSPDLLSA